MPVSPQLLTNANLASMVVGARDYGLIEQGAIAVAGEKIAWAGPLQNIPDQFAGFPRRDLAGRLVTPALIDCHTHLVFADNRALEFEMRLNGASYEEIARAGGGIIATVKATRAMSEEELLSDALTRVDALIAEGVSLIEVKSGYGLDLKTELAMLRVARRIAHERKIMVRTTFLGAHAVPPEYKGRSEAYLEEICLPALRAASAQGLVDAVDGFCEGIAFQPAQIAKVFDVAADSNNPARQDESPCRIGPQLSESRCVEPPQDNAQHKHPRTQTTPMPPKKRETAHAARPPPGEQCASPCRLHRRRP